MAVTHPTVTRTAIADLIRGFFASGGTIELRTAGDVEVATLAFGSPGFAAAVAGVITANAIVPDSSATGGVVTKAVLIDSGAVVRVNCSVTATGGGGDIQLSTTTIVAGQAVSISSLTYTAPL